MSNHEPRHALTAAQRSGETETAGSGQTIGHRDAQGRIWGPCRDGSCYRIVTPGPEWEPGCWCDQDIRTAAGEGWERDTMALHRAGFHTVRDVFRATRDSDPAILECNLNTRPGARGLKLSGERIWFLVGRLMRREREFNEWQRVTKEGER